MKRTLILCTLMLGMFLVLVGCNTPVTPAVTPTTIGTTATPTAVVPTATAMPHQVPLLPQGTKVPAHMGAFFSYRGIPYTIVPGKAGRIWGVIGKVSVATALSTPVGPKKVLLMAPTRSYSSKEFPSA